MPQVPQYSLPTEQATALPGVRQESVASPALLGAEAEQQIEAGRGALNAGSGLSAIAYNMDQRLVADGLFKAMSADKEAYIGYQADVQKNRQGDGAQGVTKDTATWWKSRIQANLDGMDNGQLKRLYQQHATELQIHSIDGMSRFEVQQTEAGQAQNLKADKANTTNLVASNPSDSLVTWGTSDIKKKNAYMAAQKNWSPEVLEAVNTDDLTNFHKQVIQTLAVTNKDKAQAYFEAHKSEIAGSQQAEIGQFAEKATAAATASTAVNEVWAADGPHSDTDPVNVDQMATKIREQFKNNTYTRDAALNELHQRRTEFLQGVQSRTEGRKADVNTLFLQGQTLAAVQQTPAWAELNGTEQAHIKQAYETLRATQASRAAALANRDYANTQREAIRLNTEGLDSTMRLSDPDVLTSMTRNQIINMAPEIGVHNTQQLLGKWDTLTKNGAALSEARIDNDQFKTFAKQAGLDITPNNDADKERLINLRNTVDQIIGQEQQAKKRQLTRDERDAVLQKQIDNSVMQNNGWFSSDTSVPAIALKPNAMKDAYVTVDGEKVKLAGIPARDRVAIVAARQKAGLPVTEQSIAEMYVRKTRKR